MSLLIRGSSNENFYLTLKYIVLGSSGVGKSCLLRQFTEEQFSESQPSMMDIGMRTMDIDGKKLKLQIWDTAGSESYRSITRSYYQGTDVAVLVYDITCRETFEHIHYWLQDIHMNATADIVILLIGNKSDLEAERKVTTEEGNTFAHQHGIIFLEASAKTAYCVREAFEKPGTQIYNKYQSGLIKDSRRPRLTVEQPNTDDSCPC